MEEKKEDTERLFVGNLWKYRELGRDATERNRLNKHCWILFVSSSPTEVTPTITVKSVEYELHPSYVTNRPTVKRPPFLLRRFGWGVFDITVKITLRNKRILVVEYPLQFGTPLVAKAVQGNEQFYKNATVNVSEILEKFWKRKKPAENSFVYKTGQMLNRHIMRLEPPIRLHDFNQTPETIVKIMAMFCEAYCLRMPEEILQLVVAYSTPCFLRVNAHQAIVFQNCYGISVELIGKGKQVLIDACEDFSLKVKDLINFVEVYNSKKINVTVTGEIGVPTHKIENTRNLKIRFRENSSIITFINQFSRGLVQAAPFSESDYLKEFKDLKNIFLFPQDSSRTRWSKRLGWQCKVLTNRMREAMS